MKRLVLASFVLALGGCTAAVSDLGNFTNYGDACDPRPTQHVGDDLVIHFQNMSPHIDQDIRMAVEVGAEHNVEALVVLSTLPDPNETIRIPEIMPPDPATLAFWADTNENGVFDPLTTEGVDSSLADGGVPPAPDHQWFRPICPSGEMTFTHFTPFQDIRQANAPGAVFHFSLPAQLQNDVLFAHYRMAVWAVEVDQDSTRRQTRAYYRYAPFVNRMPQRTAPTEIRIGGNVLMERRGVLDVGSTYEIHFVIDGDRDGVLGSGGDFNCTFPQVALTAAMVPGGDFTYTPDLSVCDDNGFDVTNPPVP